MNLREMSRRFDLPDRISYPSDIPGLLLWMDPDDKNSITLDDQAVPAVSEIICRLGVTSFVQTTEARRPPLISGVFNGRAAMRFDGTNTRLIHTGTLTDLTLGTVVIVYKTGATLPSAGSTLLATADTAGTVKYIAHYASVADSNAYIGSWQNNNDTSDRPRGNTTGILVNTAYLGMWLSDGSAYRFRVGGVEQGITMVAGSDTGDWWGDCADRDNVTIGALVRTTTTQLFIGDIGLILLYDHDLTAPELAKLEPLLKATYF